MKIEFTVPAVPVAQPRQRHRAVSANGRTFIQNYTSRTHPIQAFKATVQMAFAHVNGRLLTGPLRCEMVFVMPRPKRLVFKTREMPRAHHVSKPDVDNLAKGCIDALSGLAFSDDTQISQCLIEKWIAAGDEQPHVLIRLEEIE